MQIITPTEFIRNSKKIFKMVTENEEPVIIHRQKGEDLVLVSLKKWNEQNEPNDDALHGYANETEYLLSTEANRKHLMESIQQGKEGKVTSIKIKDLWK